MDHTEQPLAATKRESSYTSPTTWERSQSEARRERVLVHTPSPGASRDLSHCVGEVYGLRAPTFPATCEDF
jgi:hypothetical protein